MPRHTRPDICILKFIHKRKLRNEAYTETQAVQRPDVCLPKFTYNGPPNEHTKYGTVRLA